MSNEESLVNRLRELFSLPETALKIQRTRRVLAEVAAGDLLTLLPRLYSELEFQSLCTMTGQDEGERLSMMYHLCHANGIVLTVKVYVSRNEPILDSISKIFPSAVLYEREAADLLGFRFNGLPVEGSRYPLVDDWPAGEYPLRKDWNAAVLDEIDNMKKPA